MLLLVVLAGCSKKEEITLENSGGTKEVIIRKVPTEKFTVSNQEIYISGASIYRGTVKDINELFYTYTLEQYPGGDYGAPQLNVVFKSSSRTSFEPVELEKGDYIEIFYSSEGDKTEVDVLGANYLGKGENRNYNGKVAEVIASAENPKHGKLILTGLSKGSTKTFLYENDGGTQFYLNFDQLKPDDKINVYHSGSVSSSQGDILALEIRPYVEPIEEEK